MYRVKPGTKYWRGHTFVAIMCLEFEKGKIKEEK